MDRPFETVEGIEAFWHRPLKEAIFEVVHARVVAGKYVPGEWLRQEDIATQLGVSQTPVREALDLLVSAGLAERIPYRGVRVLQPTAEEIADSYAMRLLLGSAAAGAAARSITPQQLEKLSGILEQTKSLVTLNDMSSQRQLNRELHLSIAAAAGNSLLYRLYVTVANTFPDWLLYEYMFRHPELLPSSLEKEYKEHRAIVDAIAVHDADLAARHAATHVMNRGRELEIFLSVPGELLRAKEQQVIHLIESGVGS